MKRKEPPGPFFEEGTVQAAQDNGDPSYAKSGDEDDSDPDDDPDDSEPPKDGCIDNLDPFLKFFRMVFPFR